eukprot:1063397-Pleurochrysis_carterae.AAC.1
MLPGCTQGPVEGARASRAGCRYAVDGAKHHAPFWREVTGERDGVKASGEQLQDSDVEPLGMEWRQIEVPERAVAISTHARRVGVSGRVGVNGDDLPRGG